MVARWLGARASLLQGTPTREHLWGCTWRKLESLEISTGKSWNTIKYDKEEMQWIELKLLIINLISNFRQNV
jgi:hypothetical protein